MVVLVRMPGGKGRRQGDGDLDTTPNPLQGPPEAIAEELRAYARAGRRPRSSSSSTRSRSSRSRRLAPALELLDRG